MNQIDLNGRNAIVTGGARGIGYSIAERLLSSRATCSLWDRDATALKGAAESVLGQGRVQTCAVNLDQADSVEKASQSSLKALGAIDSLVDNAGIAVIPKKTGELYPDK